MIGSLHKSEKRTQGIAIAIILIFVILPYAVPGTEYSEKNNMLEVPAREILAKIQAGEPVEYDHVIVKGDLNLNQLELPAKCVNREWEQIDYYSSIYHGSVLGFMRSTFHAFFTNATLVKSPIRIRYSRIEGMVDFSNAIFQSKSIDFSSTKFRGHAYFNGSQFTNSTSFGYSKFNDSVSFSGSQFNGRADFFGSQFNGLADFSGSQFNSDVNFWASQFNGLSVFPLSHFNGSATFGSCLFNKYVDFSDSKFNSDATFYRSKFNNLTTFGNAIFQKEVYFSDSEFNGGHYLDFQ